VWGFFSMADLNWSQFEKRLRNNLRVMWYKSVKGERFELSKRTLDWDGEHKFTEGIAVCGIRYTDKVTENRREVVREREIFYVQITVMVVITLLQ
jgi:hypothetical protein